jgi:hypothetical protein
MITQEEAEGAAVRYILEHAGLQREDFVMLRDRTIEVDFGWVFLYESPRYLQTGREVDRLIGNAPVAVLRNGRTLPTGTAQPLNQYIEAIRDSLRDHNS